MNIRLLPWAGIAVLVLFLAIRSALPGKTATAPAGEAAQEAAFSGPEIRLGPVEMRELHDDGSSNRLAADGAVYAYSSRTVTAGGVKVSLGDGTTYSGTTVRAPRAVWDLEGKAISLPAGGEVERTGGWTGEASPSTLDLAGKVLRVPGPAKFAGPGVSVHGKNLAWQWEVGKITMESPKSRIEPQHRPGRKG